MSPHYGYIFTGLTFQTNFLLIALLFFYCLQGWSGKRIIFIYSILSKNKTMESELLFRDNSSVFVQT